MSTYTSFAVLGAGGIDKLIVAALATTGTSVIILTHPGSSAHSAPAGANIISVELISTVTAVLKEYKTYRATRRGFMLEFIQFIPWFSDLDSNGKFNIIKDGEPGSFTAEADITGFIAHVLTTKPPAALANNEFRGGGEHATLEEITAIFKKQIVYVKAVSGELDELRTSLHTFCLKGLGITGFNIATVSEVPGLAGSSKALWERHQWKTTKEANNIE